MYISMYIIVLHHHRTVRPDLEKGTVPPQQTYMQKKTKSTKDALTTVLDAMSISYIAPADFEQCRTKQGSKLPFDAMITVDGRFGLIMLDGKEHFAVLIDAEEHTKQQERNYTRNIYARNNKISILRITTTDDVKLYITSFIAAMKQANTSAIIMVSNPVLYDNFYGDGSKPQFALVQQRQEEYPAKTDLVVAQPISPTTTATKIVETKPVVGAKPAEEAKKPAEEAKKAAGSCMLQ